jgi:hypothetical protein
MPRAAAEREISPFAVASPALPAPSDLTEEQVVDWLRITSAFDADWFDAGNAPLLVELCRHLSYSRHIGEQLAALRKRALASGTPTSGKQLRVFNQLLRMQRGETQVISMLSVKLRLSNSAHRTNDPRRGRGDGRLAATVPSGPKPWEQ